MSDSDDEARYSMDHFKNLEPGVEDYDDEDDDDDFSDGADATKTEEIDGAARQDTHESKLKLNIFKSKKNENDSQQQISQ